MRKILDFLVHSNIYLSLGAFFTAYMSMVLLQIPFMWEPLVIPFCGTFFLYNLNRKTDTKEDKINHPKRVEFIEKHGASMFYASIILYVLSLVLALLNNFTTFLLALVPFILVFFYSVFRLKRVFLLKNIIVGLGWGIIPFIVNSYFNPFIITSTSIILFLFIFFRVVMNSSIFDLKDVVGDKVYNISTIPGKYGTQKLRIFSLILNTAAGMILVFSFVAGFVSPLAIPVMLITLYNYVIIFLIERMDTKYLCEIFVDGDGLLMGALAFLGVSLMM